MNNYQAMVTIVEDIDLLIEESNKALINKIIDEILHRGDLFETKKEAFVKNLPAFKERYDV